MLLYAKKKKKRERERDDFGLILLTTVNFDCVKAVSVGDEFKVGAPTVEGAVVSAKVLANGKGKKIYVMKYKSKKNEKKKIGHRQPYTKVQILSIQG